MSSNQPVIVCFNTDAHRLPSGVLELADLFEVHSRDLASGSRTVPSFEDALYMQQLLEQAAVSSASGHRIKL